MSGSNYALIIALSRTNITHIYLAEPTTLSHPNNINANTLYFSEEIFPLIFKYLEA